MYKEFPQLNNNEANNLIKKWAKEINRHFPKEDIPMDNKHTKRCSASLIIREMQIKTTRDSNFYPVGWLLFKTKQKIASAGKNVEKLECFCIVQMKVKWCSHCGKQYDSFLENETQNYCITIQSSNSLLNFYPKSWKERLICILDTMDISTRL